MHVFYFIFLTSLTFGCAVVEKHTDKDNKVKTQGVHHVGLAVRDLQITSDFFTKALSFKKVAEKSDYPAHFVSDGSVMVTLWQVDDAEKAISFNRKTNIGLHHLSFRLGSFEELEAMYQRLKDWPGVKIEFSPELMGGGPGKHMMFSEPGGIRLELTVTP